MATKTPSPVDLAQLHSLERNLEAKLRRQEAVVLDTTSQLGAVRQMLEVSKDL